MGFEMQNTIHVVVFKEGNLYIASGVEVDIMAQGKTLDEAIQRLEVVVHAEMADRGNDLSDIGPAPDTIQKMFKGPDSRVISREQLAA